MSFIKKYLKYDMMKKFYPVRTDEEVLNNFENSKYAIPILVIFCTMFYVGENTPGIVVSCLMYFFYAVVFILSFNAKKHIQKIRKYEDIFEIIMFAFPEYYTIILLCENTAEVLVFLMIISIFLWVMSLLIKLPYIIKSFLKKADEKSFHKHKKKMNTIVMLVLGAAMCVFAKVRYSGMETVAIPVFVLAFHLCFTMLYNFLINRIIFSVVYCNEIKFELEQQRKMIEERKNNRRTLRRKKEKKEETGNGSV